MNEEGTVSPSGEEAPSESSQKAESSASMTPGARLTRRAPRLVGAAIISGLVIVAIGVWLWRRPRPPEPPALDLAKAEPEIVETITEARREVEEKPFSGPAWGHLGMVLRAHDFSASSNDCFAQAERLDAREPRWPYLLGLVLVHTDSDAGIACLERAVERCGNSPLAPRLRLAEALLDAGRLDEAEGHLQSVLELDPEEARAHLALGRLAMLRENWRAALEQLSACVADEHSRKLALIWRTQVYRRLGEGKAAEADESQAASLPDDVRWPDPFAEEVLQLQRGLGGRLKIVDSLRRAGRLNQAIALLEETAQKYPTSFLPWLRMADLWRVQGRIDRAEEACQQAVQADPEAAQAWFALGCYQALKRPREAADTFRRVIRLKPDHTLAHFNLAYCLGQLGDPAGAAEEYRLALRCRPDYEPARTALKEVEAKILERKGKGVEKPAK